MDPRWVEQITEQRTALVKLLLESPERFSAQLYRIMPGLKANEFPYNLLNYRRIFSDIVSINDPVLCCLIGCQIQQGIVPTKEAITSVCLHRTVKPMEEQGRQSQTLMITIGLTNNSKTSYVAKVMKIDEPYLTFMMGPTRVSWMRYVVDLKWGPNVFTCKWLSADAFTVESLILSLVADRSSQTKTVPKSIINLVGSGLISKPEGQREFTGIILMDYASWGSLESFIDNPLSPVLEEGFFYDEMGQPQQKMIWSTNAVLSLTKQLLAGLHFLEQNLQIIHTDLKCRNVVVDSANSNGNYQGLKWRCNFSIKIIDFAHSAFSISVGGTDYRIINYRNSSVVVNKLTDPVQFFHSPRGSYYKLVGNTVSILSYIRSSGIIAFYSFDLYTFLVDFLCHDTIFYTIMGNEVLKRILWDPLWFPDDADLVYRRIRGTTIQYYYQIMDILRDIKLKPNLMDILWALLTEPAQ